MRQISGALQDICDGNDILHWWEWWEAWKFYIIPSFRGFKIPGLNLAETGHSMIKTKIKMCVSMATYRDVCFLHYTGLGTHWISTKPLLNHLEKDQIYWLKN